MEAYPQPGIALLQSWMLEFIRFGLDNPNHYEIMFMMNDSEIMTYSRTEQAQCLDLFSAVVREVVANDQNSADALYTLPWSLFMSLHGFISHSIHYEMTYDEVEKLAEDHVRFLCRNLKHVTPSRASRSGNAELAEGAEQAAAARETA
jgi:hypothetical protein